MITWVTIYDSVQFLKALDWGVIIITSIGAAFAMVVMLGIISLCRKR
jgi:hypothetical protein